MDDLVAALLCVPFLIAPLITLIMIIASKIEASHLFSCLHFHNRQ